MHENSPFPRARLLAPILSAALITLAGCDRVESRAAGSPRPSAATGSPSDDHDDNPFSEVIERAHTPPAPRDADAPRVYSDHRPEATPDSLDAAPPVFARLVIEDRRGVVSSKHGRLITRTRDRIHVKFEAHEAEWLFTRNPIDGDRTGAWLIDQAQRVALEYYASDLVDAGIAGGWRDIAAMGVRDELLDQLTPTTQQESFQGIAFTKFVPTDASQPGLPVELWWNDELCLPLKIVSSGEDGVVRIVRLRELTFDIDRSLLVEPSIRFGDYDSLDLVDWREQHRGGVPGGSPFCADCFAY
jgi:hypothetical protein